MRRKKIINKEISSELTPILQSKNGEKCMADDKGDWYGNFAKETVALITEFPFTFVLQIVQKGNENEESYQIKWTVLIEREIPISNNQRNVFWSVGRKSS